MSIKSDVGSIEEQESVEPTPTVPEDSLKLFDEQFSKGELQGYVDMLDVSVGKRKKKKKQQNQKVESPSHLSIFSYLDVNKLQEAFKHKPEEDAYEIPPECCEAGRIGVNLDDFNGGSMDLNWFQKFKLSPEIIKKLCFAESLLIIEEDGTSVGKVYFHVTEAKWGEENCFCVHSGSYADFSQNESDDFHCGTSITAFVSTKLKCINEFVHEWAKKDDDIIERKIFLTAENQSLHCRIQRLENSSLKETNSFLFNRKDAATLITEGVNVLFMRFIVFQRKRGEITLKAISKTGSIVPSKYTELGRGWENVRGNPVKTWSFRRTVMFPTENFVWDCVFNGNGRMMLRCQPDSDYAYIPLWFESSVEFSRSGVFTGAYAPYTWACDADLYSQYLDKKDENFFDNKTYLQDHPEVEALLSDFLQAILLRKPDDILQFAMLHFEPWLASHLVPTEAFASSTTESSTDDDNIDVLIERPMAPNSLNELETTPNHHDGADKNISEDIAEAEDMVGEKLTLEEKFIDKEMESATLAESLVSEVASNAT